MTQPVDSAHSELQLLEVLEKTPETTQSDLARSVGVAVGTVNWHLKRWSKKGYVKISRLNRWNWSYLLTPEGIAHKTKLASEYLEISLRTYRETRETAKRLLSEVKAAGYDRIYIDGEGEIAEIVGLTCLEMGLAKQFEYHHLFPMVQVIQTELRLVWTSTEPLTAPLREKI